MRGAIGFSIELSGRFGYCHAAFEMGAFVRNKKRCEKLAFGKFEFNDVGYFVYDAIDSLAVSIVSNVVFGG